MSSEEPRDPSREHSWGHRHGITLMTAVLFGLLALIITIQTAC
ncbi:MAG TPA: hypothetical protein VHN14_37065 [Kofleriaceae bacterium]|jgi:hypothetical protein|nr:hypothetical protein [Kofleriaceae bacterium]